MPTITFNSTNEDNYSFDDTKIEFVGGVQKLLASGGTPEAYMYVTMDDNVIDDVFRDLSGNSRDGALKGGLTGSNNKVPAKINNGLLGLNNSAGNVAFGVVDFDFDVSDSFSLELWIKTTSNAVMNLMSKQDDTGFQGYAMICNVGKARVVVRDQLGNVIAREFNLLINDDVFHHVVMTYDGSGVVAGLSVYVDNTQNDTITSSDTLTGSLLTPTVDFQISGRDGNNNCIDADTIVDECVVYARELTAAEVALRWNNGLGTQTLPGPGVSFPTDNPTSQPKEGFRATELTDFDATVVETGSDTLTFTILVDGVEKYWNGSAWVDSTGYPQTNSAAVVKANISSLVLADISSINAVAYFHSDDGSTTPELDNFTFEYNAEPTSPFFTQSVITGNLFNIDSSNPDVSITVNPIVYLYGTNTTITNAQVDVVYDSSTGEFEATISVEDVTPDELVWKFGTKEVRTKYLAGNVKFSALDRIYP